jgi:hypothetical protein
MSQNHLRERVACNLFEHVVKKAARLRRRF